MHHSCSYTRHYKKAEGTETHAARGGQVGGLSRMTQRRLRGQVDDAPTAKEHGAQAHSRRGTNLQHVRKQEMLSAIKKKLDSK